MQTTEWQLEKMNTQLASWAELRHDNILYAKQSYTGGTGCTYQHVYLEPYPEFYRKLAKFATEAERFFRDELSGYSIRSYDALTSFYNLFAQIMEKLEAIAEKELRQEPFTSDQICWLKSVVNGGMSSGPSITGWYNDLFYDLSNWTNYSKAMNEDFIVADVHTQPTDKNGALVGHVLHAGTGKINLAVVGTGAPSNSYKPTAFIGPVMSFHTKVTSNFYRYNDQEWEDLFWSGDQPPRPDWVNNYLANAEGRKRGEGRSLHGSIYTGTSIEGQEKTDDIAYFISKPNPAVNNTLLKFVLNKPSAVRLDIYDILGRKIESLITEEYNAGEHDYDLNVVNYHPGLYYLDLRAGNESKVIKLMVR